MRRLKGKIVKLGFDFMLAALSVGASFYLYTRGQMPPLDSVVQQGLIFATFYILFSALFGTHRTVWRYTSVTDLFDIGRAVSSALFVFGVFQHFFMPVLVYSPTFIATQGLVLMALMTGQRLFHRLLHEGLVSFTTKDSGFARSRVLLVGAASRADKFIKIARLNPHYGYEIVGLVDSSRTLFGEMLHGVPILGKGKHLEAILKDLESKGRAPQRLVFTETVTGGGADFMDIPQKILDAPEEYGLKLSRLGDFTALHEGIGVEVTPPMKPVAIEDLLGRPQTHLDIESIRQLIAGKRVIVTGAGGTIGGELSRQIARLDPAAMALLDFSEYNLYALELDMNDLVGSSGSSKFPWRAMLCNVRVAEQVKKVFAEFQPDIVFHAAALKHVPLVEANPSEGVLTNIMGTRIIAEACQEYGAGIMVQISTDKAVNPCNVMGATKRMGEALAQSYDLDNGKTRFVTVRFGNVLGSSGSVVPLFRKQLERGGPLTVTHPDICRFFMTISEAVSLVLQASAHAMRHPEERGRILVLDMGEQIKIVDVARQMIRLASLRPDIDVKIDFVGLRPGEKMFEELFDSGETRTGTDSPKILAAVSHPMDGAVLRRAVATLEDTARRGEDSAVIRHLQAVVPGYVADPALDTITKAGFYARKA